KWEGPPPSVISLSGRAMSPILQQVSDWFSAKHRRDQKGPISKLDDTPVVMSDLITLIDDGERINSPYAGPFDLDGIPNQKTILINHGVLKGALYDAYTGAMDNRRSTGNKLRSFSELEPQIRVKGICLEPSKGGVPGAFWKETGRGLAIVGWTRLNILSNRYLDGDAHGWRIHGGEPTEPVRLEGLRWDLENLLKRPIFIGNDPETHGFSSSPTVFFKGAL
ncbi:MAG: metallopeptidase TldD-related protein, partial [Pseudomonadota bacterium]